MKVASVTDVLTFWFETLTPQQHFTKDDALDKEIQARFCATWAAAAAGELWAWRETLQGRLAEIIVLDQFSRNLYREDGRAFAQDNMALVLCQELLQQSGFEHLNAKEKQFVLMPMMHSESLMIQDASLPLFKQHCDEMALDFAQRHRDIVAQFGRFPHRNQILKRESTAAEMDFLQQPGSSF